MFKTPLMVELQEEVSWLKHCLQETRKELQELRSKHERLLQYFKLQEVKQPACIEIVSIIGKE